MSERRIFVAGSTGAVGRTVLRLAAAAGDDVVPHLRPRTDREPPPGAAVFDLADAAALRAALARCAVVLQLIGTMRRRFAAGDTYETSDIGTTRLLVEAARGSPVDHVVLLSSVGAGKPMGAYLRAKAEAEALVTGSGLAWTILRPSHFVGEGHRPPPGMAAATRLLGLRRFQPITVEDLARTLLHVARTRAPLGVALEGESLWQVVAEARHPGS